MRELDLFTFFEIFNNSSKIFSPFFFFIFLFFLFIDNKKEGGMIQNYKHESDVTKKKTLFLL